VSEITIWQCGTERPAPVTLTKASIDYGLLSNRDGESIISIMAEDITALIDQFVQKVNARQHGERLPEDIPEFLRRPYRGEEALDKSEWTDWQILAADHTARIRQLEARLRRSFPKAFRDLITRYSFPEFDCGPLTFFSNTGHDLFYELSGRLFLDPHMSPVLLEAGYLQIGNPFFPNYDPVCLAPSEPGQEGAVVQLDHEMILQHGVIQTVSTLAPSFVHLLNRLVQGDEMPDVVD
jgi:hypothetical protein